MSEPIARSVTTDAATEARIVSCCATGSTAGFEVPNGWLYDTRPPDAWIMSTTANAASGSESAVGVGLANSGIVRRCPYQLIEPALGGGLLGADRAERQREHGGVGGHDVRPEPLHVLLGPDLDGVPAALVGRDVHGAGNSIPRTGPVLRPVDDVGERVLPGRTPVGGGPEA